MPKPDPYSTVNLKFSDESAETQVYINICYIKTGIPKKPYTLRAYAIKKTQSDLRSKCSYPARHDDASNVSASPGT